MFRYFLSIAATVLILLPATAAAEPTKLKLSFYTSDRSNIYQNSIKPFVEAVNDEGRGLIEIEVHFGGTINKVQANEPKLVADGTADIALVTIGRNPNMFPDSTAMTLPGIFRDQRQASLVFTRLIGLGALKGYEDFFVVGAFVSDAESIHSRKPIASIKDLAGLTVRTNNKTEAAALERLGAKAIPIAINQTMEALSEGQIDGATFPPSMVFDFGVGRVTKYHYMIQLGGVPNALVMNREKFENLPPQAQVIIRKYSGKWLADRSATAFDALDKLTLAQLKSDPRRTVVFPSPSDAERTQRVFASVVEEWAAQSPHNRELLALVRVEIAKLHSPN
jgi:TRAP-type C4-dicarboxylate transport system substrate-binding protein